VAKNISDAVTCIKVRDENNSFPIIVSNAQIAPALIPKTIPNIF
jgi:hypothetical protein